MDFYFLDSEISVSVKVSNVFIFDIQNSSTTVEYPIRIVIYF